MKETPEQATEPMPPKPRYWTRGRLFRRLLFLLGAQFILNGLRFFASLRMTDDCQPAS
jgi:hypothetical protein